MERARLGPLPLTSLALLFFLGALPNPLAAQPRCRPAPLLAEQAFDGDFGSLAFIAELGFDVEALASGKLEIGVRLRIPSSTLRLMTSAEGWAQMCLALVADDGEDFVTVYDDVIVARELDGAAAFDYGVELGLPDEVSELVAVIELPALGLWGAVVVDQRDDPLPPPGADAVRREGPLPAWYRVVMPGRPVSRTAATSAKAIKLVPPRKQPVTGSTRIDALISSPEVGEVAFYLDDVLIATRDRGLFGDRPFSATFDFARPPRPQTVRAVARSRSGHDLGEDVLVVNPRQAPFRVSILGLDGNIEDGAVIVSADVAVPHGAELASVEVFRNQTLIRRFDAPPYRAEVPTDDPTATDYVRVAATLTDGQTIDDVVLLLAPSLSEQIDVNLVPVFAVVRGNDGKPVRGLDAGDFGLRVSGTPREVGTFRIATDLPLVMGLVIDTSGSMDFVMDDTRRAAVGFLQSTLRETDRGFVVDFDKQPRLRQETTSDMVALLRAVGQLRAEGLTSLYDAIVFAMLQFEREGERRALVVLSDGADIESRFGPKDCVAYGKRLGVPVYLIAMHTFDRVKFPKKELERISEGTGGGLFFIDSIDDLPATYETIEEELRSQYVLSFYTERDLDAKARASVEVSVEVRGASVRTVVGSN